MTRWTALGGGAPGIAALILEACGSSGSSSTGSPPTGSAAAGIFGSSPSYKFTFVNHVTTNSFFTPTQNGVSEACKLLGCTYQWTGSQTSNLFEMVNALNSAVSAGSNGIAVSLIDLNASNSPVQSALSAGIPRTRRASAQRDEALVLRPVLISGPGSRLDHRRTRQLDHLRYATGAT